MELIQYWKIIRKRWWLPALLVFISCLTTGFYTYFAIQPVYEASTKLIVNKSDSAADLGKIDLGTINSNIQLIKTYKEVIKTPRIMNKVISTYPDLKLTSDDLIQKISVNSVNDTQVMTVVARDESYARAAKITNAVSHVFQKEIPTLMKVDNVSILNEADTKAAPAPVSPNLKLNLAISFVLALMLGMGIIFLLEYLDDTLKTEQEVREFLDLPTLSMIPKMNEQDLKAHGKAASVKLRRSEAYGTLDA
ncbi:lipopolysaccharide biosynthesis protein [Cohnella pontilimi]|uniref:Lipopolysaccharide biosynthesis protein n=1 Tax=Cohnella pontilimi TaxID=2564100 RepID=A0A4U0FDG6_9BACL|nr:Wzz/FepE/Etk N-terminal domain-containing protein [Cohnella pontilimi]TJY42768.1 lipopolysaccharide biosynthesis protein [Cohnella pontilimi]